ncbi:hypothetical protein BDV98DRAFT_562687 [Pterulicium gracile]|uniref:Transmembrane protein n=1 Tax=Pterulicium gracile TaxID=1884261 RepID=A0A5C3QTE3_9AGAR|nr:hypothetical protein BDV98DRAFT_562687 [Pterula gracilis]
MDIEHIPLSFTTNIDGFQHYNNTTSSHSYCPLSSHHHQLTASNTAEDLHDLHVPNQCTVHNDHATQEPDALERRGLFSQALSVIGSFASIVVTGERCISVVQKRSVELTTSLAGGVMRADGWRIFLLGFLAGFLPFALIAVASMYQRAEYVLRLLDFSNLRVSTALLGRLHSTWIFFGPYSLALAVLCLVFVTRTIRFYSGALRGATSLSSMAPSACKPSSRLLPSTEALFRDAATHAAIALLASRVVAVATYRLSFSSVPEVQLSSGPHSQKALETTERAIRHSTSKAYTWLSLYTILSSSPSLTGYIKMLRQTFWSIIWEAKVPRSPRPFSPVDH